MIEIKFDHKITFKRCKKCGKGHDLSAISCSKPQGLDEERTKQCTGKLELIQFNRVFVPEEEIEVIKNK